jgi:hypothetical protein
MFRFGKTARRSALLIVVLAVATAAVLVGSGSILGSDSSRASAKSSAVSEKPCGDNLLFGHIESMTSKGDHFELRFDPAWFLSGATANTAAAEDGAVEPGQPVPNDNYVLEEGHRLLTYVVPPSAHVTVLTKGGTPENGGFASKAITVAQLAQLVKGEKPVELFESLESGLWMRVHIDSACSLEQQYRP